MSTEDRLARLGLLHLIDKPEELRRALSAGLEEDDDDLTLEELNEMRAEDGLPPLKAKKSAGSTATPSPEAPMSPKVAKTLRKIVEGRPEEFQQ